MYQYDLEKVYAMMPEGKVTIGNRENSEKNVVVFTVPHETGRKLNIQEFERNTGLIFIQRELFTVPDTHFRFTFAEFGALTKLELNRSDKDNVLNVDYFDTTIGTLRITEQGDVDMAGMPYMLQPAALEILRSWNLLSPNAGNMLFLAAAAINNVAKKADFDRPRPNNRIHIPDSAKFIPVGQMTVYFNNVRTIRAWAINEIHPAEIYLLPHDNACIIGDKMRTAFIGDKYRDGVYVGGVFYEMLNDFENINDSNFVTLVEMIEYASDHMFTSGAFQPVIRRRRNADEDIIVYIAFPGQDIIVGVTHHMQYGYNTELNAIGESIPYTNAFVDAIVSKLN